MRRTSQQMIGNRSIGLRTLALLCQLVLVTASFWVWLFIWQPALFVEFESVKRYLLYHEFLLIGILFSWGRRQEPPGGLHEWVGAMRQSFRQTLVGLFWVFLILFALQDAVLSRTFFFSYIPWLYLTLLFSNYFVPRSLSQWAFSGDREERVALAGTVEQAQRLRSWLSKKSFVGLRTVGLIVPQGSPAGVSTLPYPILGTLEAMGDALKQHGITQVIVLDLALGSNWISQITQLCENAAVRLLAVQDLNAYFNHNVTTFEDDGVRFISLREEPLESPLNRFLKRLLDLVAALPVVILILPLATVLVWILQRAQSPGPIFYSQVRTGMMGKPITIYKYRTMHVNQNEAKQAAIDDPRVFPAGRWLRKLSIDELPQFINVLKGDMSVVG